MRCKESSIYLSLCESFHALEEYENLKEIFASHAKDIEAISIRGTIFNFISSDSETGVKSSSVIVVNDEIIKDEKLETWIEKAQWLFQNTPESDAWPNGNFLKEFFM